MTAAALALPEGRDLPDLVFDVPGSKLWDVSDAELAANLDKSEGRAFIALRSPGGRRAAETLRTEAVGPKRTAVPRATRAAISKAAIAEGLAAIIKHGVVIRQFFDATAVVDAQIDVARLAELRADPHVEFVEAVVNDLRTLEIEAPADRARASSAMSTTMADIIPDGISFVGAPSAWTYSLGAGARVLIIDTGYDRGHPDLPNTPLGNCTHGQFGGCDDGFPRPHGTRATGVIAALQNGAGVVGVAPGLSSLAMFHWGACNSALENGPCDAGEVASALNWAVSSLGPNGVINMSLAGPTNNGGISMGASAAYAAGHVLVAGAGNDGILQVNYPASYSSVISVGAINPNKAFPPGNPNVSFCDPLRPGPTSSQYLDVVGPWFIGDAVNGGGGWLIDYCGGTSMAAASVSGVAALVRARNPTWPNWKVFYQLTLTAEDVHTAGFDNQTGYGLVRAPLAVGFVPPNIVATIVSGKPRLTWSSVPLATDYAIYSKITPTICPNFQQVGTTAGTAYTDQSIQVTTFVGYDVATPTYTAVSYQVFARSAGLVGQASRVATYRTTLANPPC